MLLGLNLKSSFVGLLALGALIPSASAQSVKQILDRTKKFYESQQTYEVNLVFTSTTAQKTYTQTVHVIAELGANGMIKRSASEVDAPETPAGAGPMHLRTISDGQWTYSIHGESKTYTKRAHVSGSIFAIFTALGRFATAPDVKVATSGPKGKQFYLISSDTNGVKATAKILKSTGEFISLHTEIPTGKPYEHSDFIAVRQFFNKTYPSKLFRWTPPKGYQLSPR